MPKISLMTTIGDYDECEELLENIKNGNGNTNCSALILRVNNFIKKPSIEHDLTGILNTYLEVLHSSEVYIKNGIFNTNFAEAALLIQGASILYGKKVDLLWNFVIEYLNRNISYEKKTDENKQQFEALEELKMRNKRQKKAIENIEDERAVPKKKISFAEKTKGTIQGMNFADFQKFKAKEYYVQKPSNIATYEEVWENKTSENKKKILESNIQCGLNVPENHTSTTKLITNLNSIISYENIPPVRFDLMETNAYGEKEPLGDYGSSSLIFDSINGEFNSQWRQVHEQNVPDLQVQRDDVPEYVLQKWITEKRMDIGEVYQKTEEFIGECNRIEKFGDVVNTTNTGSTKVGNEDDTSDLGSCCMNELEDSFLAPLDKSVSSEDAINEEVGLFMNKRSDPIRKTTDSDLESGFSDASRKGSPTTPQKDGSSIFSGQSDIGDIDSPKIDDCLANSTPIPVLNETIIEEEVVQKFTKIKRRRQIIFDDENNEERDEEALEEVIKPKRRRRVKEKMLPTTTTSLKKFEKFFNKNYNAAEGEGTLNIEEYSDDEEDVSPKKKPVENATPECLEDTFDSGIADMSQDLNSSLETELSFADIMGDDINNRYKHVLEWKKFISEKIGSQRKSDFDIHVEETNVIESIGEIGEVKAYKDICKGKTAAAVTRNFIALLHLANTENVSFLNVQNGKLSNESLEVKLLSTDRHHEHLDEYDNPGCSSHDYVHINYSSSNRSTAKIRKRGKLC